MNKKGTLACSNDFNFGLVMTFLGTLLIKSLERVLVIDSLLARTAGIGTAFGGGTLELVDSSTSRVLVRANFRVEASVVLVVVVEATLVDVAASRLGVLVAGGDVIDVGGGLATVELAAAAAAGSRILASVHAHLLLSSGRTAGVTTVVSTGEVTLSAKGLGVLLLALAILTEATYGSRRELGSGRCVGVVQSRLAARNAHGLGTAVLGESTALSDGLGSERVASDGARRLLDGLLGGKRVVGDLGAAVTVRKRSALEIHGGCVV